MQKRREMPLLKEELVNLSVPAEAICEAMSRPTMRFVTVKSVEQQDIQAVHRIRSELVSQRTAKGNQIRGLVAEYGLVAPQRLSHLRRAIPRWLEDAENGLSGRLRRLLDITRATRTDRFDRNTCW
jgi:transposase